MDQKNIFFALIVILNFHRALQCGSGSSEPPKKVAEIKLKPVVVNETEVIESTHYLKFLKDFESASKIHRFDPGFHVYLKCNGSYHEQMGRVMHGLCSYCVEMQPTKNNVYWRCMDKCFTTLKTSNCLRSYEELVMKKVNEIERYVKELSGSRMKF